MAVQIFHNNELNDVVFEIEALEEWKQYTIELGLEKQLSIAEGSNSPNPYAWMNKGMTLIFQTLCPTSCLLQNYDKSPIPLEIMKQLSFAKKENYFQEIAIWYDDKSPDPIAVGYTFDIEAYDKKWNYLKDENKNNVKFKSIEEAKQYCDTIGFEHYGFSKQNLNKYLIARWGDELKPVSELKSIALERLIDSYGATLKNEIEDKQQALKKLKENALLYLNGEITETQLKGQRW